MTRARSVLVAFHVLAACSVSPGDGATFGAGAATQTGDASDGSGDGGGAATEAPGSDGEADDGEPASSGDPGSTSSASGDPGSEAGSVGGSEDAGSESSDAGTTGGPLTEHDYGPCTGGDPASPCGDQAECIVVEGFDGSFCSPWCDEDLACPDPTTGEAFAQCQLGPDLTMPPVHCALLCQPGSDECPAGMNCVDTGMPVGLCLFQGE